LLPSLLIASNIDRHRGDLAAVAFGLERGFGLVGLFTVSLYFGSGLSGEGKLGAGDLTDGLGGCSTPLLMSMGSVFCSARNSRSADSLCGLVDGTLSTTAVGP
jgi:hypothetical protein